jgi:hypothetical protein
VSARIGKHLLLVVAAAAPIATPAATQTLPYEIFMAVNTDLLK